MPAANCITKAAQLEPDTLYENVSLARFNTWRVGGPARWLYVPSTVEQLSSFLKTRTDLGPVTVLGLGSNVLISDDGIPGLVVLLTQTFTQYGHTPEGQFWAEAGISCAKVAKVSQLEGLAFMAGIPGSLGGALAMNAGAFGGETWRYIDSVEVMTPQGQLHQLKPAACQIQYRSAKLPMSALFVSARFKRHTAAGGGDIKGLLKMRAEQQPIGLPSCGSVFKNPDGEHAAQLIERCGLKGFQIGGAQVSPKHANFIINENRACAKSIIAVMRMIVQVVYLRFNIELVPEVKCLGFAKDAPWKTIPPIK